MGHRRHAREAALQGIYMCDFHGRWEREIFNLSIEHFGIPKAIRSYVEHLGFGVIEHIARIDEEIAKASEHWSISRMARVDRSLLRIAAFEILYQLDVPAKVAINEAIEISKDFGSDDSPGFINGVLDRLSAMRPLAAEVETASEIKASSEPKAMPANEGIISDSGNISDKDRAAKLEVILTR